jgi:phosphoglycolate phosphatase-like HAD superfamily hydrolase
MTDKKERLIVFDWNGTLLADAADCLYAMNKVLEKLGSRKVTMAQYRRHYTMPLDKLYHAVGVDPRVLTARENEIHPLYHATYSALNIKLRRGAKAMLKTVRKSACKSVILSNYVVERIERQAENFGIREHFDDIIAFHSGDATFRRRVKGEYLKDYLKASPASEGIIVGDTEEEIEIGRDLGMVTIAITDGMCSTSRLRGMKPDFLIRELGQIPAIVRRVFGGKEAA